jgi:hypothetical protein
MQGSYIKMHATGDGPAADRTVLNNIHLKSNEERGQWQDEAVQQ